MTKRERRPPKVRPPSAASLETPWRLFITAPMPDAARELIAGLIDELSADDWPVRWVAAETAHLTLHFLGDTAPERAGLLRMALATPVARHARFDIQTGELGVFPNPRKPRVLWLGLGGAIDRLDLLYRDIGTTLKSLEFPVERGHFRPHLTLGRVRDAPPQGFAETVERRLRELSLSHLAHGSLAIPVEEVLLVRSFLGKGGARHDPIGHYPLSGTP